MRAKYHLDEPLWNQYVAYLDGVVHFDFGESVQSTGQGVSEIITTGFGPSAIIGLALIISLQSELLQVHLLLSIMGR